MSLRGVRQLKELIIRYSDYDGSSKGVREWMSTSLLDFAARNPQLNIKTLLKRNKHPYVEGHYLNGNIKTISVRNMEPKLVERRVFFLRNQIGRRVSFRL